MSNHLFPRMFVMTGEPFTIKTAADAAWLVEQLVRVLGWRVQRPVEQDRLAGFDQITTPWLSADSHPWGLVQPKDKAQTPWQAYASPAEDEKPHVLYPERERPRKERT